MLCIERRVDVHVYMMYQWLAAIWHSSYATRMKLMCAWVCVCGFVCTAYNSCRIFLSSDQKIVLPGSDSLV